MATAAVFLLLLWLLNDILLPFVVGIVVAYFLDPVVARLQRLGMSRTWATTSVTIFAVLIAVGVAMAILPPLFGQVQSLIVKAPDYTVKAAQRVQPLIEPVREKTRPAAAQPAGTAEPRPRSGPAGAGRRRQPSPASWRSAASPSSTCWACCS